MHTEDTETPTDSHKYREAERHTSREAESARTMHRETEIERERYIFKDKQ